mmetsp:Transcript_81498/g.205085  ORF Transcript_81498/g.205085 Transcript_81498/m.205085 type:complete len:277 (+) Transcript_81498:77-907(+)
MRKPEQRKCPCGADAPKDWTRCLVCRRPLQQGWASADMKQSRTSWADLSEDDDKNSDAGGVAVWGATGQQTDPDKNDLSSSGASQSEPDVLWLPSLGSSSVTSEGKICQMDSDGSTVSEPERQLPGSSSEDRASSRTKTEVLPQDPPQLPACDLDLLAQVPRNAEGELTSVGSIGHAEGKCSPCVYWFKGVCARGVTCRQCHFLHEGQKGKRLRPSKHTRQRLRNQLSERAPDSLPPDATLDLPISSGPPSGAATAAAAATPISGGPTPGRNLVSL